MAQDEKEIQVYKNVAGEILAVITSAGLKIDEIPPDVMAGMLSQSARWCSKPASEKERILNFYMTWAVKKVAEIEKTVLKRKEYKNIERSTQ